MTINPDTLRRIIDYHGGPLAAGSLYQVDRRKMQRIYAGKESCPPGLARDMIVDINNDLLAFMAGDGVTS